MGRLATRQKWRRILRDAEREFEHRVRKEKKFLAALRRAGMRAARVVRDAAQHKITVIKIAHNLRTQRKLFMTQKTKLKGLGRARATYLRTLRNMKKERLRLFSILREKKLTISHKLHHAREEKRHWLNSRNVLAKKHNRMLAHAYAWLKQQRDKIKKELTKIRFRENRNTKHMLLVEKHAFNRAALKESHLVMESRHIWSKLHVVLQSFKKRMAENARHAEPRQKQRIRRLEKEKMGLIKLLAGKNSAPSLPSSAVLWSLQVSTQWREKQERKMKAIRKVISEIESKIKRAGVEEIRLKTGGGRYRQWLAKLEGQLRDSQRNYAFLTRTMERRKESKKTNKS